MGTVVIVSVSVQIDLFSVDVLRRRPGAAADLGAAAARLHRRAKRAAPGIRWTHYRGSSTAQVCGLDGEFDGDVATLGRHLHGAAVEVLMEAGVPQSSVTVQVQRVLDQSGPGRRAKTETYVLK